MAAVAPLYSWLIAACVSRTVLGAAGDDSNASSFPMGRRARRRFARSKPLSTGYLYPLLCKDHAAAGGSLVALCGSGLQGLGSCFSFEACPEYSSLKGSQFFPDNLFGLRPIKMRRRQRRLTSTGKAMAIALQPVKAVQEKTKIATKPRRVVVTGMGVVTSLGHDPDTFYGNLLQGQSGISEIESFDCSDFPTRIAGEIKSFSTDGWVAPKFSRRMDKFMLYLLTAGKKAVADGGMNEDVLKELDKAKCGVVIGSALGGMKVFNDAVEALRISYRKMNPFCVPFATTNMGSAMMAMDLGWMGPNYSISTACATSNFCIISAANHILRGEADVMLSGGSDAAIIPIGVGGFVACRALSQRNEDPTKASRPWDVDRDGFVMGEGAGVLLLEELEHAKKRGAKIYAEFLGGSSTSDAYHMTNPHPEGTGVLLCMENALRQAGVRRENVNYVNAHATSTQAGDLKEYQALIRCFGQNPELKLNSTKSMIGHLLGASGAVEAVATVQSGKTTNNHSKENLLVSGDICSPRQINVNRLQAIRTGWVHPTINLENPEKDVDMKFIVGPKKERLDIKVALSNSFGFGGHNSSLVFAPYEECNEN